VTRRIILRISHRDSADRAELLRSLTEILGAADEVEVDVRREGAAEHVYEPPSGSQQRLTRSAAARLDALNKDIDSGSATPQIEADAAVRNKRLRDKAIELRNAGVGIWAKVTSELTTKWVMAHLATSEIGQRVGKFFTDLLTR
jgi:hypothetical protein